MLKFGDNQLHNFLHFILISELQQLQEVLGKMGQGGM